MKIIPSPTKVWLCIIIFITVLTFGGFIYFSLLHLNPKEISREAVKGKKVWGNHGCAECHSLLGNGGYLAGDLTNIVNQQEIEWLENFLINPPLLPSSNKRHVKLDLGQTKNLIEYLRLVNEINTLGWRSPPKNRPFIQNKASKLK